MDNKVPKDAAQGQPADETLLWHVQAHRLDTIRRLQSLQPWIDKAIQRLSDPASSERQIEDAMKWGDSLFAVARGGKKLEFFARMEFLEYLNSAAIQVREQNEDLSELAERAFTTCVFGGWAQYWSKLWVERASGDTLTLFEKAILAWVDGVQWERQRGAPVAELLRSANLFEKSRTLESLKKQWTGKHWRAGPMRKVVAELFPYGVGPRPVAAASAARKSRPGPKPKNVVMSREQSERMVDREQHSKEIEDHLFSALSRTRPGVTREGIARLLPKR